MKRVIIYKHNDAIDEDNSFIPYAFFVRMTQEKQWDAFEERILGNWKMTIVLEKLR